MFLLADDQVKKKLEAEHRRFLKVIFQLRPNTKAAEVYKTAKTTSLEERIQKLAVNWFNKKMEDEHFENYISTCKCYGRFDKYNTTLDLISKIINQD